jgi:soluble lytic murein transglycosylase-like protein
MRALLLFALPIVAALLYARQSNASVLAAGPSTDASGANALDFSSFSFDALPSMPQFSAATWADDFSFAAAFQFTDAASAVAPAADAAAIGISIPEDTLKRFQLPARAAPYSNAISSAESFYNLPPTLLGRVLYQESKFRPEIIDGTKRSPVGAIGIAQFMPRTAAGLGIDPLDPFQSIDAAAKYLRQLFDATGDWTEALAAYNWGIGNLQRKGLDAAPLETRNYYTEILNDVTV